MTTNDFSILVVDDEDTMRRTLAELVRLEGYQVSTARDGDDAIQQIQNKLHPDQKVSFDLILLDLKMPGRDGLDVLSYASLVSPETQVILLTAHGSLQSAIEALRHGANDYILKPAQPDQILASVRRAIEQRTDQRHRHALLEQLETSLQALRERSIAYSTLPPQPASVSVYPTPADSLSLFEGVTAIGSRREIMMGNLVVTLSPIEWKLLATLAGNPGKVFPHRELVAKAQGYDVSDREAPEILRPLISRLRRKLARFPGGSFWIVNIRSSGYVFEPKRHSEDRLNSSAESI